MLFTTQPSFSTYDLLFIRLGVVSWMISLTWCKQLCLSGFFQICRGDYEYLGDNDKQMMMIDNLCYVTLFTVLMCKRIAYFTIYVAMYVRMYLRT